MLTSPRFVGSSTRSVTVISALILALAACGDDSGVDTTPDAGGDHTHDADTSPDADDVPDARDDETSPDPDVHDHDTEVGDEETDTGIIEPAPPFCDGSTQHLWDPLAGEDLEFFPDGTLVREDPDSPTGWRIDITDETAPWLEHTPSLLIESFRAVNDLSGFGALGGALLRFDAPVNNVPPSAADSVLDSGWLWLDLGMDPPERVPFEARVFEDGLTVVLWPLRPLRLNTDHALILTTDATADDGACIAPSEATRYLLHGASGDDRFDGFSPLYRETIERLDLAPEDITAISVFRTHNDLLPVRRAAERVVEGDVAWLEHGACIERGDTMQCETRTTVLDFRDERGLVNDTITPVEAEIPVTYWLPRDMEGPFPVIVYGHGLNSERTEGYEIARRMAEHGFAVVSMEAVEHGDHPSVDPGEPQGGVLDLPALRFLGIDIANFKIDARAIRGNFNQTNLDRLRLVHLIRTDPDINGDGIDDLDPTRVAYIGASLGAICGSGLMALSPDIDAAAFIIGGARLISIVTDTQELAQYRGVIDRIIGSPEAFDRLMPVAQHLVDPADAGTWAPHVIHDRFDGRTPPSIIAPVGIFDEIVPPASGRALARALGLDHLGPVLQHVELLDVIDEGPIQGNSADGQRTHAFFQFDRVTRDDRVRSARHTDTAKSDEVGHMIRVFFGDWAQGDVPRIVDPYIALGTPPLEDE